MKMKLSILAFLAMVLVLTSCDTKYEVLYYTPAQEAKLGDLKLNTLTDYQVTLPVHLQRNGLFARPVDNAKATLGRVIFYDKKLSKDGKVSCASCHLQEHGFSDVSAKSKGVNDRESTRNSIALSSVVNFSAYYGTDINGPTAIRFFWDNRAETVEQQSRGAFTNPDEMGMHMSEIVSVIKSQEYYEPLFQKAFNNGDDISLAEVTEARVFEAMSHFINSLGSFQSRFDTEADKLVDMNSFGAFNEYKRTFPGFSSDENAGKALYNTHCAGCHSLDMGRPVLNFANNGLDVVYKDKGVGGVPGNENNPSLQEQFKVPTLRNIELSAPYMHDGRFATLEQVIDHYSTGIQNNPNLHGLLKSGNGPKKMNFTQKEKEQLIAFMKTLTDNELKTEVRFSNPFK